MKAAPAKQAKGTAVGRFSLVLVGKPRADLWMAQVGIRRLHQEGGFDMRKLVIGLTGTAALLLAGILGWSAEATTLTGAATVHPATNYSLVGSWKTLLRGSKVD